MTWVKRNLFFLIGSVVALALMGAAGWYAFQKNGLNNEKKEKLNVAYAELKGLKEQKPHPGDGKKVDNIKLARDQQEELHAFVRASAKNFQPIAPIPASQKFTMLEFTEQLRETITQLEKSATANSVTLQPKYNFSFEVQKNKLALASGSLEPLSVQLGEVKAICEILFRARINALEGLRRERVSADDAADRAGMTDYHEQKSVTNDLGVLTRYEVAFRSFTPELAAVLAGFASSPHGFIVKGIGVEPALVTSPDITIPAPTPIYVQPQVVPQPQPNPLSEARYGREGRYGKEGFAPPPVVATPVYVTAAPATPAKPPPILNEKLLRATLVIEVIKLRPPSPGSGATSPPGRAK